MTANPIPITDYMKRYGLRQDNTYQDVPDLFTIYPRTYFSPAATINRPADFSEETVAIHHFAASWVPKYEKMTWKEIEFWQKMGIKKHFSFLWHLFHWMGKM